MTRPAMTGQPFEQPLVDDNGILLPEYRRLFELVFDFVEKTADAVDASSGTASGSTVDDEWNAFINSLKQD